MTYREKTAGVTRLTGGNDDTGWIAPTLINGWAQYASGWDCLFKRKNGMTIVRGLVAKPSGVSLNLNMFILPVGFRPAYSNIFYTAQSAVTSPGAVNAAVMYVMTDGSIHAETGGNAIWTSLSGITFPAEL